jgi:predicted ATPase
VLAREADEVHLPGGGRAHAPHRRRTTGLAVRLQAPDVSRGFGWELFTKLREPQQAHDGSTISRAAAGRKEGNDWRDAAWAVPGLSPVWFASGHATCARWAGAGQHLPRASQRPATATE